MKKNIAFLLLLCMLCSVLFSGCSRSRQPLSKTGIYFDTVITITLYDSQAARYIEECFSLAKHYEDLLSRTKEGSDIWKINHSHGSPVRVDPETFALLRLALSYCDSSHGLFDITIGSLSSLWDFSSKAPQMPTPQEIETALSTVDYHKVRLMEDTCSVQLLSEDAMLDLGGIAKGYIADQMKSYLLSQEIDQGIINLGGNILCLGPKEGAEKTYNIAIQKPFSQDGEPAASVKLTDASVVTSGVYQRYFEQNDILYHHILNPEDGYPVNNGLYSVTIISDQSADGDALSTVCFLMGLEAGMEYIESLPDTEAVFITEDQQIYATSGLGHTIPFTIY